MNKHDMVWILLPHQCFPAREYPDQRWPRHLLLWNDLSWLPGEVGSGRKAFHLACFHGLAHLVGRSSRVSWDPLGSIQALPPRTAVHAWDPLDRAARRALEELVGDRPLILHPSPCVWTPPESLREYRERVSGHTTRSMAHFYKWQRQRTGLLMQGAHPEGGRWSLDVLNRSAYRGDPRDVPHRPSLRPLDARLWQRALQEIQGTEEVVPWCPVSHVGAKAWLQIFVVHRLPLFGQYQDALVPAAEEERPLLWHSGLSLLLHVGLLLPGEVARAVLQQSDIPLAAREGFLRQLLGWREYCWLYYIEKGSPWDGRAPLPRLPSCWYEGTTGLKPVDRVVRIARRYGYAHHIERLMVLANAATLCRLDPHAVFRWMTDLFWDSYDWVMSFNTVAMGMYTQRGWTTKPYISSSKYLLRQGEVAGEWEETWDALYTAFLWDHRKDLRGVRDMHFQVTYVESMDTALRTKRCKLARTFLREVSGPAVQRGGGFSRTTS